MIFEIHYSIGDYEDFYILEGDNIKEIQGLNTVEMEKRNLDEDKNNCYSIEVG